MSKKRVKIPDITQRPKFMPKTIKLHADNHIILTQFLCGFARRYRCDACNMNEIWYGDLKKHISSEDHIAYVFWKKANEENEQRKNVI